jgi:L-alanine-DL-glutamate epimerase-like enolase superfamily enzyme
MAHANHLPIGPHDCTGPINFAVGVHFGVSQPNAVIQEVVRAYYSTWFRDLVTALPRLERGYLYPLETPGVGMALLPEISRRRDATVRSSRLEDV